ncbi:MAG: hypothetical protein QOK09_4257, partial [Mycobacterium sp.]|nr:hypothetical protein [Mycobacterium sp.]
ILTAENKSPTTITSYLRCARLYPEWCERHGHPVELTRAQVQRYAVELDRRGQGGHPLPARESLRADAALI